MTIVILVCLLPLFIAFNHLRGRYKRTVHTMSATGEAYICTMEIGTGYRVVSADQTGVTIWKLHKSVPVPLQRWLWPDLSVAKVSMQLTSVRMSDGLELIGNGQVARLALYTAKSTMFSSPINGTTFEDCQTLASKTNSLVSPRSIANVR